MPLSQMLICGQFCTCMSLGQKKLKWCRLQAQFLNLNAFQLKEVGHGLAVILAQT